MGIDFVPTGIATGTSGTLMGTEIVKAIAAGTRFVMPAGLFIVYAVGADVRMQVQDSTGVWQNVTAVGVGVPCVASDGTNVAFQNAGGASENITYQKIG